MKYESQQNGSVAIKHRSGLTWLEPLILIGILALLFGYLGSEMGAANMVNTIFNTAHELLLNTVLFLMGITVLAGALGQLMGEFGVIRIMEYILAPLMKPLYNLPGRSALAALMTFFSDNPAIISLAKDHRFAQGLRPWQLISLTNFGTAFGMGLLVLTFMSTLPISTSVPGLSAKAAMIGLLGALIGSIASTRLMQQLVRPLVSDKPLQYHDNETTSQQQAEDSNAPVMLRVLNALLDGGKSGVELGLAVIPGVVIISTLVMLLTFGPGPDGYSGSAFEGVGLLPHLAAKLSWLLEPLFGFHHPELIAFPVTSLGAVGAALSLVPEFIKQGMIGGNEIAVFTAIGMCWSGFLSTHTAMLDTLGYRHLTSRAIIAHSVGGLLAGISAHFFYLLLA